MKRIASAVSVLLAITLVSVSALWSDRKAMMSVTNPSRKRPSLPWMDAAVAAASPGTTRPADETTATRHAVSARVRGAAAIGSSRRHR